MRAGQPKDIDLDQQHDLPRGSGPHDTLSRLPLELIHNICSALDIPALCNFRRTCRTTKSIVDSYLPYQWLSTHHPWVIRAMIKAGATEPTCSKIYFSLHSETCSLCKKKLNLAGNTFPDTTPRWEPIVIFHVGGLYLPTGDTLCCRCSSRRQESNRRDFTPWSEPHLRKHLSQLRRECRKRGEDTAPLDWARTQQLPYVRGLPKVPNPTDMENWWKAMGEWGWTRPKLYDADGVEETFGVRFDRSRDSVECGCQWESFPGEDQCERRRVMLPLAGDGEKGALVVYHRAFYDQPRKKVRPTHRFVRPMEQSDRELDEGLLEVVDWE